jgi:hypothetical protein
MGWRVMAGIVQARLHSLLGAYQWIYKTKRWIRTRGFVEASIPPCSSFLPSSTSFNEPWQCRSQARSWKTVLHRLALAPAADRFGTSSGVVLLPSLRAPGLPSTQTSLRPRKMQIGDGTHVHCGERASCCMPSSVPNSSLFGLGVRE